MKKIYKFLKENDITLSRLSRKSGISRQTIYNLIEGNFNTRDKTIDEIARVLEISTEELKNLIK